jgi:hypothetical protein
MHMFLNDEVIDLSSWDWHPRVLLAHYYQCLVGQSDFPDATISSNNYHPFMRQVVVEESWEWSQQAATYSGVPEEGLLDDDFNVTDFPDGEGTDGAFDDGDGNTDRRRKASSRQPVFNQAYSAAKQFAISDILGKTNPLWKKYCLMQNDFLEEVSRMHVGKGGAGKRNRMRAAYERDGGHATKAAAHETETEPKTDWMVTGLKKEKAHDVLRRGATEGWVLEVFPDKEHPQYKRGDRWFAEVRNGLVTGMGDDLKISSCKWYAKNSITIFENISPTSIEIKMVKAYGPRSAAIFADLQ